MANLAVVAASVKQVGVSSQFLNRSYLGGATLTAGMVVSLNGSSKWIAAEADSDEVAAGLLGVGIILHGAALDQPCTVAQPGAILDLGVAIEQGETYVVSATAGLIAEFGDLIATNFTTVIGYGNNINQFVISTLRIPFMRV